MNDVTRYPLRTNARSAYKDLPTGAAKAIKEFSWADDLIYTVFNSTLHSTTGREINFHVEVEQLRADRADVAKKCGESAKLSDAARVEAMRALLEGNVRASKAADLMKNNLDFQCHTAYLSTAGFAAFFKTLWKMGGGGSSSNRAAIAPDNTFGQVPEVNNGLKQNRPLTGVGVNVGGGKKIDPNSVDAPPPKPSQTCATQKFIYLKTHKTGSSTILSILHRYSFKYQLNSALPIDNMYLGWPTRKGALKSFTEIRGVKDYDVFASGS